MTQEPTADQPQSVFASTTTEQVPQQAPATTPNVEQTLQQQMELVGQGKKYKDVFELEKGKLHADQHIATLESETASYKQKLAELEAELNKRKTAEEIAESLKTQPKAGTDTPSIGAEDVQELVASTMTQYKAQEIANNNISEVSSQLTTKFGSVAEANKFVKGKAAELGMTVDGVMQLAASSPSAALSMLNVNGETTVNKPATSVADAGRSASAQDNQQPEAPVITDKNYGASVMARLEKML